MSRVEIDRDEAREMNPLRDRFCFTPKESTVAGALADGLTYKEIAKRLGVSYHTVHSRVKAIHEEAGVGN